MNTELTMSPEQGQAPSPERINQLSWGYAAPLIIETAVHYNVFELLEKQNATVEDIASATRTSRRGMEALLNALVGIQLLQRQGDAFSLTTESAAYLVSGKPGYRGAMFRHHTDQLLPQWMALKEIVRSGHPVAKTNKSQEGAGHFVAFVEALFASSFPAAWHLGIHLEVAKIQKPLKVLDVGAGSGVWGIALACQSPLVHITAVDWPEVLEVTQKVATRHRVNDRLSTIPGDFVNVEYGQGYQVATLGHILHSEGPDRILSLLRKIHASLDSEGTIAIQEFLPNDDRTGPALPLLFAVNMLVNTEHGNTYTFAEISQWLVDAGFKNPRKLETPGPSPLILGTKR